MGYKSKKPRRPGRPSKLSDEITQRLTLAISNAVPYEAACQFAGLDYSTFRDWIRKGEDGKYTEYVQFAEQIKKAVGESETLLVMEWRSQQRRAPDDWVSRCTMLERRFPERWARQNRTNLPAQTIVINAAETSRPQVTDADFNDRYSRAVESALARIDPPSTDK